MGLKSWSKKASADLASGKTVMRMRQQTKEYLGSTQKTVDNELISKIEAVKTMEHDLKVLVQLTMEVRATPRGCSRDRRVARRDAVPPRVCPQASKPGGACVL